MTEFDAVVAENSLLKWIMQFQHKQKLNIVL